LPASSTIYGYWQGSQSVGSALNWFCGNGARCSSAAYYGYDAGNQAWNSRAANGGVCALVDQLYASPGGNIATIGHSAGGLVATMLAHSAASGLSSQFTCNAVSSSHTVAAAANYVRSVYTIATPFLGSEVASSVCAPHSSITDVFHNLSCASVVGSI